MKLGKLFQFVCTGLFGVLLGTSVAQANPSAPGGAEVTPAESWAFKLTPSYYMTTHEKDATDLNLRVNSGAHAVWLGYYQRGNEFEQTRTGYEYTAQLPFGQVVPSIQLATHGFVGGSVNTQLGDPIYALLGYGRTNARDYYNLNFDPNDAITYGLGTRLLPKSNLLLFTVKDNRLHTGQMVTHFVWRFLPDEHQRWTVDLSSKHGRASVDEDSVSGKALALTYDYHDFFIHAVRDSKVNFTIENQTRISVGLRF